MPSTSGSSWVTSLRFAAGVADGQGNAGGVDDHVLLGARTGTVNRRGPGQSPRKAQMACVDDPPRPVDLGGV
jgi:hypothetical protein